MRGQVLVVILLVLLLFSVFLATRSFDELPRQKEVTPPPEEEKKPESVLPKIDEARELKRISEEISRLKDTVTSLLPLPVKSDELYHRALSALINIFCEDLSKGQFILGSGALVHPNGYVLTNAHLAEFFDRKNIDCVLRRGSPSQPFARATTLYFPDQSEKIGQTGIPRKDFAILKITGPTGPNPLPEPFEYFEINPGYEVKNGEVLYSLGYPTEFLGSVLVIKGANILFTLGAVEDLVNIDEDKFTAEGANLKGEISAQHGSSGGIFLEREKGKIVGLFVGLTEGKTTSERTQFMFLASYLNDIFFQDKGTDLLDFLNTNP